MLATNLFIYQARVWPGPSRVSDSPGSAENVIYETFVVRRKWHFSALISRFSTHSLSFSGEKHHPISPDLLKVFFCVDKLFDGKFCAEELA